MVPALRYRLRVRPGPPRSVIRARSRRHRRRRALFDHLLVTALDRAFALEQVHDVAVIVRENLDLDVPRPLDQPLDVERAVAERRGRLAPRRLDRLVDVAARRSTRRMPLPPPPADALISAGSPTRSIAWRMPSSD